MPNKAKWSALTAALLFVVGALAGCEVNIGTSSDEATQLERIIEKQLAGKVADQVENPEVEKVTCVEKTAGKYDCIAKTTFDAKGGRKSQDVMIEGSCVDKNCVWETKN